MKGSSDSKGDSGTDREEAVAVIVKNVDIAGLNEEGCLSVDLVLKTASDHDGRVGS